MTLLLVGVLEVLVRNLREDADQTESEASV